NPAFGEVLVMLRPGLPPPAADAEEQLRRTAQMYTYPAHLPSVGSEWQRPRTGADDGDVEIDIAHPVPQVVEPVSPGRVRRRNKSSLERCPDGQQLEVRSHPGLLLPHLLQTPVLRAGSIGERRNEQDTLARRC